MPAANASRRFLLTNSPLELAVFEARFPARSVRVTLEDGIRMRDLIVSAIGTETVSFPSVESAQTHEVTLTLGPDGAVQHANSAEGVQISDPDSGFAVSVFPTQLAVQVQSYVRWSVTLRPLIAAALAALSEILRPEAVSRVGLRYVNRFRNPDARSTLYWAERIEPSLAGPLVAGPFSEGVIRTQHQVELALDDGVGVTIRHGAFPEPTPRGTLSYLLDVDVYVARTEPFTTEAVLSMGEALNRRAAEVFRTAMLPKLAEELGLRTAPERSEAS